ncbi:MAG: aldolase/citrate lyase family protein [Chloroflexota bacterium]|nr:aldolase/citrate lyase family protein [Chloroflexota bacterium]
MARIDSLTNPVKAKLRRGEVALGVGMALGSPNIVELLARQGFDWVLIDNQHGTWGRESTSAAFMAARAGGAVPIPRVLSSEYTAIGHLLDEGCTGIVVPMVDSPEEAEQVVHACKYPPAGGRSLGAAGAIAQWPEYMNRINDELLIMVQIESKQAAEAADEIMAVDGVDGTWVGPADLAASIGHAQGTTEHTDCVVGVFEACRNQGKIPGISAGPPDSAKRWIEHGARFVTLGADVLYVLQGAQAELEAFGREPGLGDWS